MILLLSHFIMVLLNFHHLVTCFFCLINHVSSCVSPIFMTVFFFHVFIILPNFSHPFSSFRYCLKGVCTFHHYHFLIIFHHIAMFLLLFSYFIIFSSSLIISSLFSTWFCDRPHFSHQLSASCQCHWHSFIIVHHASHIFFILTLFLFFIAFHHLTHNLSSFCHCFWMCCSSRFIIFLNNFHHRAMVFCIVLITCHARISSFSCFGHQFDHVVIVSYMVSGFPKAQARLISIY